jgi:hypothetical protein
LHQLVDRGRLAGGLQGSGPDLREVHQIADDAVQAIGFFEHRREQFALLVRIVDRRFGEQARHRRLDRRERRPEIVRHAREQRRAKLVGLRVELRPSHPDVEACALDRERRLLGRGLQESVLGRRERVGTCSTDRAHDPKAACLRLRWARPPSDPVPRLVVPDRTGGWRWRGSPPVKHGLDLAADQIERVGNACAKSVENARELLA